MFTIIGQFIRGLILGWILSLIGYLIKRALSRAFGGQNPFDPASPHSHRHDQPTRQHDANVIETIWVGMKTDQLLKNFGSPQSKQVIPYGAVWTYANLNGAAGTETEVTIQHDAVVSWQDKRREPPAAITG